MLPLYTEVVGKNSKMEVKKPLNSDEDGGREVRGEVGTCNKAEIRLERERDAGGSSRRAAAMWVRHRLFPTDLCRCILSSYTSTYPPAAAFQEHRHR